MGGGGVVGCACSMFCGCVTCECVLHAGQLLLCGLLFGVYIVCMFLPICMLVPWLLCMLHVCVL